MCVPHISVVVFLTIEALVTLVRFGFHRSSGVGLQLVLLLPGKLVALMRVSDKCFAIEANVRGTGMHEQKTANNNMRKIVLALKVVNYKVHERGKTHKKVACFGFIGL